jgi:hypothetical protein
MEVADFIVLLVVFILESYVWELIIELKLY